MNEMQKAIHDAWARGFGLGIIIGAGIELAIVLFLEALLK